MEAEPKHVWRLPPCPAYDVEGMESWLTDQEARGLRLSRDGFFAGFAIYNGPNDTWDEELIAALFS